MLDGLVTPWLRARLGRGTVLVGAALLSGLATLTMGLVEVPLIAGVLFGLAALAGTGWDVLAMSLRQAVVPEELFGRVQGSYRTLVGGHPGRTHHRRCPGHRDQRAGRPRHRWPHPSGGRGRPLAAGQQPPNRHRRGVRPSVGRSRVGCPDLGTVAVEAVGEEAGDRVDRVGRVEGAGRGCADRDGELSSGRDGCRRAGAVLARRRCFTGRCAAGVVPGVRPRLRRRTRQ